MKRWIPVILLILAAWARFHALGADVRFNGDEALFATYGRNAAVYGDWRLSGHLDKPPLSLYAMALSMHLTGVEPLPDGVLTLGIRRGEWSARLPGALAGVITVAAVMAFAHRLGRHRAACFAGAIAALSPQMVAFDASALTDSLMLMFLCGSLAAVVNGRSAWAGVWLAAAFASKQQAAFYLPLVAATIWTASRIALTPSPSASGRGEQSAAIRRHFSKYRNFPRFPLSKLERGAGGEVSLRFLITLSLGIVALLLWDAARPEPSIFAIAADNNNPYRWIVTPEEWGGRLSLWTHFGVTAFGAWPVTAGIAVLAFLPLTRRENRLRLPWLLRLYIVLYLLAHVVLPFNVYDRYLLLIYLPLIALAASALARIVPRRLTLAVVVVLLTLSLTAPVRFPSDARDRDDGLIALAEFVNAQGLGTIVYNRWLGWEMGYYLDPWTDKRVVYYPTPEQFAADAPLNPDPAPRLLIAPAWADLIPWLDAAQSVGFTVHQAWRSADYAAWWLEQQRD